jgi:hypothetical protein
MWWRKIVDFTSRNTAMMEQNYFGMLKPWNQPNITVGWDPEKCYCFVMDDLFHDVGLVIQ